MNMQEPKTNAAGGASALSAGLDRFTHESLRKWGEALDREIPHSLGERILCYADDWRSESEACAALANEAYDFVNAELYNDAMSKLLELMHRMRSNAKVS